MGHVWIPLTRVSAVWSPGGFHFSPLRNPLLWPPVCVCLLSDGSFCVPVWTVNTHPLSDSVGLCGQLLSVWQTRVRGQARRERTKATLCQDSAAAWDPPSLPLLLRCCCWVKLLAGRQRKSDYLNAEGTRWLRVCLSCWQFSVAADANLGNNGMLSRTSQRLHSDWGCSRTTTLL